MNTRLKICLISTFFLLPSCSVIQPNPNNKPVRLVFYDEINLMTKNKNLSCNYLGSIVSSDGHWYNYLFINNDDLTNGAINDMYNKASRLGANTVYINSNIYFATSVTLLGQAYVCKTVKK